MKEIQLRGKYGKGKFAIVDDEDFEFLNQFKWHVDKYGYARKRNGYSHILMQNFILKRNDGMIIDHIDRNKLNNQKNNFRQCAQKFNTMNRRSDRDSSSQYKGVAIHKSSKYPLSIRWQANIMINGKSIKLGYFKDEIEAARVYDEAAKKYHGEFAKLNFPT